MIRSIQALRELQRRPTRRPAEVIVDVGSSPIVGRREFHAMITGGALDGANRWAYTFVEAHKTAAGHDGWATKTGGRAGTLRNRSESMNAASGMLAIGVTVESMCTSDFTGTLRRIPDNRVVGAWEETFVVGDAVVKEYWCDVDLTADGVCVPCPS